MSLPTWMRGALFATTAMNLFGAAAFLPSAQAVRAFGGLPEEGHPFYLATIGMFLLLFGVGYGVMAVSGRADRLLISLAAAGKLSFCALLVGFSIGGALSARAPLVGVGDLIFATLFLIWLFGARRPALRSGPPAA